MDSINKYQESYNVDVVVIGAGHAGIEAATASARMGVKTLLISMKKEDLGQMSCNPAIGGVGKGILVKEIDALSGIMGHAIDKASIHFKMLNRSKGPAVWGPRAQSDRKLYKEAIKDVIFNYENLQFIEGEVIDIITDEDNSQILGVRLASSKEIKCSSVILTTGTFLSGLIHIGEKQIKAGRLRDKASNLSDTLKRLKLNLGRLKTGTPPRILKSSIDYSCLEIQSGEDIPVPFSYMTKEIVTPQINCYLTRTNIKTHEIIRNNLSKSAMYSGNISGIGPRYCPSIEDKVSRFEKKESHQVFLEPEGLDSEIVYPNGLSTSLPAEIQLDYIRSIKGLEKAEIIDFGYAIEYDYVNPRQLSKSLSTPVKGLFLAGQINGTTGYEEAGAQGLVAGINAARFVRNQDPIIFCRTNSYIGVMIDDLVTLGVTEPYRMFTSRAEYRISIRSDNADKRLTPIGIEIGCVDEARKNAFLNKIEKFKSVNDFLSKTKIKIKDNITKSLYELLGMPNLDLDVLCQVAGNHLDDIDFSILEDVKTHSFYSNYLKKQKKDIEMLKKEMNLNIPYEFNYNDINGLSNEIRQKLNIIKPRTFSEMKKIEGMTPVAMATIIMHLQK